MKVFKGFFDWASKYFKTQDKTFITGGRNFEETLHLLGRHYGVAHGAVRLHIQTQLPFSVDEAKEQANNYMEEVVTRGGEGIIVRAPRSYWVPKRMHTMLKVKPENDSEGTVIGYYWGEETTLGSKLLGLMGSLIVHWNGKTFKLSGFTDGERILCRKFDSNYSAAREEGINNPGQKVSDDVHSVRFPRGTQITFSYRELTNDGLPKEARYMRVRTDE
jgi:ATP-dependent DNA ligase